MTDWELQEDQMPLLNPAEETFVVGGTREEWLAKLEDALRVAAGFWDVKASEALFRVHAKYRKPPVWGSLTVSLLAEGPESTRINAKATAALNALTLISNADRRILEQFSRAIP